MPKYTLRKSNINVVFRINPSGVDSDQGTVTRWQWKKYREGLRFWPSTTLSFLQRLFWSLTDYLVKKLNVLWKENHFDSFRDNNSIEIVRRGWINNRVLTVLFKICIMNATCKIYNLKSILQLTLLIPAYEARLWPELSKKSSKYRPRNQTPII